MPTYQKYVDAVTPLTGGMKTSDALQEKIVGGIAWNADIAGLFKDNPARAGIEVYYTAHMVGAAAVQPLATRRVFAHVFLMSSFSNLALVVGDHEFWMRFLITTSVHDMVAATDTVTCFQDVTAICRPTAAQLLDGQRTGILRVAVQIMRLRNMLEKEQERKKDQERENMQNQVGAGANTPREQIDLPSRKIALGLTHLVDDNWVTQEMVDYIKHKLEKGTMFPYVDEKKSPFYPKNPIWMSKLGITEEEVSEWIEEQAAKSGMSSTDAGKQIRREAEKKIKDAVIPPTQRMALRSKVILAYIVARNDPVIDRSALTLYINATQCYVAVCNDFGATTGLQVDESCWKSIERDSKKPNFDVVEATAEYGENEISKLVTRKHFQEFVERKNKKPDFGPGAGKGGDRDRRDSGRDGGRDGGKKGLGKKGRDGWGKDGGKKGRDREVRDREVRDRYDRERDEREDRDDSPPKKKVKKEKKRSRKNSGSASG